MDSSINLYHFTRYNKKSLEKGLGDNTKLYVKQKSYSLRDAFNDYKVHPEALDSYFEY